MKGDGAGEEGGSQVPQAQPACSGCLRSMSRALAMSPNAASTTSLPGRSVSLFWARSFSRATPSEPGGSNRWGLKGILVHPPTLDTQ